MALSVNIISAVKQRFSIWTSFSQLNVTADDFPMEDNDVIAVLHFSFLQLHNLTSQTHPSLRTVPILFSAKLSLCCLLYCLSPISQHIQLRASH